MLINIQSIVVGKLIVDGDLVVQDTSDINITARSVFIRSGSLHVGNSSHPFTHQFTIQINGGLYDSEDYIDPLLNLNKYLVVTGSLALYGVKPASQITYLKQGALKGDDKIHPGSSSGWKVGDKLSLSPSFSNYNEYE